MTNEGIETLPAAELDHLLSKFFKWTHSGKTESTSKEQSTHFQCRIVKNEMKRLVIESDDGDWLKDRSAGQCISLNLGLSQRPTLTFLQSSTAVETSVKFRYESFLKSCLYSTWLPVNKFVFKLVVLSLIFPSCSHDQKHVTVEALWFKWPEIRLINRKQTSMARLPYNWLLTNQCS